MSLLQSPQAHPHSKVALPRHASVLSLQSTTTVERLMHGSKKNIVKNFDHIGRDEQVPSIRIFDDTLDVPTEQDVSPEPVDNIADPVESLVQAIDNQQEASLSTAQIATKNVMQKVQLPQDDAQAGKNILLKMAAKPEKRRPSRLGQLLKGTGAFIQNLFSKEGQHMTLRYGTNERIAMDNATNDMLEKKGLAPSVKVLRNRERNYGIAA